MMALLELFKNKNSITQIFANLFLITIFWSVLANPIDRSNSDSFLKDASVTADILSQRQKIISQLKNKILSRLNLEKVPKFNKTFDWATISDEMKMMLNQEIITEDKMVDSSYNDIETMFTTLTKLDFCNISSVVNQECLELKISKLTNKEIISGKLIIPLTDEAFENEIQNQMTYYITVKGQDKLSFNLSLENSSSDTISIDWTTALKLLLYDNKNFDTIQNVLTWTLTITGSNNLVPVERIIDIKNIILEMQYRTSPRLIRKRRSAVNCQSNQFFCCTEILNVSLEDLGWTDFIVAPRAFTINYCRGDCNNYITHSSNHARALNFARRKGMQERKEMRSCCVPYSYSNLTIMYLKPDNTLAVATFNDIIASTCRCL